MTASTTSARKPGRSATRRILRSGSPAKRSRRSNAASACAPLRRRLASGMLGRLRLASSRSSSAAHPHHGMPDAAEERRGITARRLDQSAQTTMRTLNLRPMDQHSPSTGCAFAACRMADACGRPARLYPKRRNPSSICRRGSIPCPIQFRSLPPGLDPAARARGNCNVGRRRRRPMAPPMQTSLLPRRERRS